MADNYLSTDGLADALDVHPETVRRWVRAGKLSPTMRTPGGQARYELADVRQQLTGQGQQDQEPGAGEPAGDRPRRRRPRGRRAGRNREQPAGRQQDRGQQ